MGDKIDTNMGDIPVEDYCEIVAVQNGFNSYDDMKSNGVTISGITPSDFNEEFE